MEYRILGSLEVIRDGHAVVVSGRKQRALLVALLLRANHPVSVDQLVDQLWTGQPPPSAPKILQNCVSQLRRDVVDGALITRPNGYELRVGEGELDLDEFNSLMAHGRRQLVLGKPDEAAAALEGALGLWRGTPLSDCDREPFADEIARIEELRIAAVMDRVDADLALGREAEVIDELERLVAQRPFVERVRAQLMLALYRGGRQADALHVYQEGRRVLVEELGIEPGPALKRLEQAILTQEPTLEQATPAPPPAPTTARQVPRASRRLAFVVAGLVLAAVVGAVLVALRSRGDAHAAPPPNSVAMFDARTGRPDDRLRVGSSPIAVAAGGGAIWVLSAGESSLTSIEPATKRVSAPAISLSTHAEGLTSLAYAAGTPWAVDSTTGDVIRVGGYSGPLALTKVGPAGYYLLVAGGGALWVASNAPAELVRVEPQTGLVTARIPTPGPVVGMAVAAGSIWTISVDHAGRNLLTAFDTTTHRIVASVALPASGTAVAAGFGSIWVAVNSADLLLRIDPATDAVARTIDIGDGPNRVTTGLGAVWVTDAGGLTLERVDPRTNRVTSSTPLQAPPRAVLAAYQQVWVVGS